MQHPTVLTTIPLKEDLVFTEDARYAIHWHMSVLQDMKIVIPEFILDKERHHGSHRTKEPAGIGDGVERQIGNDVSPLVVLANLIT